MSRLIDADALMKTLKIMREKNKAERDDSFETSLIVNGIQEAYWSAIEAVQDAPTIDAIPVKEFCEWLDESGCKIFKVAFEINVQLFKAAMEKGEK